MTSLKIIIKSILLSICYGILHDTITANVSLEYFTVGHPKIIESQSPFMLALIWGVIATWWVGLILGTLISISTQIGKLPKLNLKEILPLMIKLLVVMMGSALLAGVVGFTLSELGVFRLNSNLADQIDPDLHSNFLAAGWSHGASYLIGILGAIYLCRILYLKRRLKLNEN